MKLIFSICLVISSVGVLCFATESLDNHDFVRSKRAVSFEYCPEKSTTAQCEEYAKGVSKTLHYCHTYIIGGGTIQWQSCGVVSCGDGLKLIPEDLNKPYPNCCQTCGV